MPKILFQNVRNPKNQLSNTIAVCESDTYSSQLTLNVNLHDLKVKCLITVGILTWLSGKIGKNQEFDFVNF